MRYPTCSLHACAASWTMAFENSSSASGAQQSRSSNITLYVFPPRRSPHRICGGNPADGQARAQLDSLARTVGAVHQSLHAALRTAGRYRHPAPNTPMGRMAVATPNLQSQTLHHRNCSAFGFHRRMPHHHRAHTREHRTLTQVRLSSQLEIARHSNHPRAQRVFHGRTVPSRLPRRAQRRVVRDLNQAIHAHKKQGRRRRTPT